MLISAPFLKPGSREDTAASPRPALTGQYPRTPYRQWHNGVHLQAPQEGGVLEDVHAVADGLVIYTAPPDAQPSDAADHARNYAAFGSGPEWTDKGLVIIEHKVEIGATGDVPLEITFYSVYAHLKALAAGIAPGKQVWRKDTLGQPGQIYGQPGHLHFEICLDDTHMARLLGRDPQQQPAADAAPTADGRTDAVFGSTYVYLPAGTPVQAAAPARHVRAAATQTLRSPQWVQIRYAGQASLSSYTPDGSPIGTVACTEPDAEYALYDEAAARHNSLSTTDQALSSPSGWYALLRFGRNLGQGPNATGNDPLPANAAHWRIVNTPDGTLWADLNAAGSYKFSDADFPAFLGWACYSDAHGDATALDATKPPLRQALCKFPSEWDAGTLPQRLGPLAQQAYFQNQAGAWAAWQSHVRALTFSDLPGAYLRAQWHVHPLAFIAVLQQCGWLQRSALRRLFPAISDTQLASVRSELNQVSGKHFLNTGLRQAHFFGQVRKETGPAMEASTESLNYSEAALRATFRSYYGNRPLEASQDGRTAAHPANQQVIANKVYAGRIGNGNAASGDGWRYRGRGLKQVTGRENYRAFKKQYPRYWAFGLQDFEAQPDLLVQAPYALRSAVWFWVSRGCMKKADAGLRDSDVDAVTGIVNPGELGTPRALERRAYAQAAYKILG